MIIFPAIDIKEGKCVRLVKGDFDQMTSYKNTPFDQAQISRAIKPSGIGRVEVAFKETERITNKDNPPWSPRLHFAGTGANRLKRMKRLKRKRQCCPEF